jgi:hypothetical protein
MITEFRRVTALVVGDTAPTYGIMIQLRSKLTIVFVAATGGKQIMRHM